MPRPSMPDAYPLQWPHGVPRTPSRKRARARFNSDGKPLSVAQSLDRLIREVSLLGGRYAVLSSNVQLRNDGWPRSNQRMPDDPGAACYFMLENKPVCFPCDKWDRVADNIAAIAAHVDALRRIQRYGVGTAEQAFRGYAAELPSVDGSDWRTVLNNPKTRAEAKVAYQRLATLAHPDKGGSDIAMARLNVAYKKAMEVLAR